MALSKKQKKARRKLASLGRGPGLRGDKSKAQKLAAARIAAKQPKSNKISSFSGGSQGPSFSVGINNDLGITSKSIKESTPTGTANQFSKPKAVANLPSDYKETEAKAFAEAEAFKKQQAADKAAADAKAKADAKAAADAAAKKAADKAAADAAAKKAAEAEATRVRRFDPSRVEQVGTDDSGVGTKLAGLFGNFFGKKQFVPKNVEYQPSLKESLKKFDAMDPLRGGPGGVFKVDSGETNTDSGNLVASADPTGLGVTTKVSSYDPESTAFALRTGNFDPAAYDSFKAGGLNIGSADSEAESNDLGRALSIGDKLKSIGGFAKDIVTQSLFGGPTADGTLTGNTDFAGNLPGAQGYDNRDVKIKGAFNEAMNSEGVQQLGEGLGLPKNFKSQLKDTAAAGNQYFSGMTNDRDSIYRSVSDTLKDLSSNPKLGTTARYINQMTTDNPNVSDSERNKKVSFFGMKTPLSNENVADIRSAFDEKNDKFQGLSMADRGFFEGGGGNRIVSGKLTDSIRGVLSGYKGDPNIGLGKGEGVTLGSMLDAAPTLASNIGTEGTLANKRVNEIKRLAPGGSITTPSLIRGQLPLGGNRSGGSTSTPRGGNQSMFIPTAPPAVQEEYPLPLFTQQTAQQTGVGAGNLQNITQNAYSNQMSLYASNPNYFAQFRPQQRFPQRGSFRSSFSRDYF